MVEPTPKGNPYWGSETSGHIEEARVRGAVEQAAEDTELKEKRKTEFDNRLEFAQIAQDMARAKNDIRVGKKLLKSNRHFKLAEEILDFRQGYFMEKANERKYTVALRVKTTFQPEEIIVRAERKSKDFKAFSCLWDNDFQQYNVYLEGIDEVNKVISLPIDHIQSFTVLYESWE